MLAQTFHSIADTGNQALLFLGMRLGKRPPDADHPFGHGKNVYFWAFVVSVMLFSLGGAFSIWEGVRKSLYPAEEAGGASWPSPCWPAARLRDDLPGRRAALPLAGEERGDGGRVLARDTRPDAHHRRPRGLGGASCSPSRAAAC